VTFTIEDDGEGISPDIRNRVFEPFFTTKKPGEGTGLGLSLVHRIVEEHGGRVEMAESELGGALFRIVLPAAGQREAPLTAGEKRDDA
jgi:signal transduction histidine kinase